MRLWLLQPLVIAACFAALAALVHAPGVSLPAHAAQCARPPDRMAAQACAELTDPQPHASRASLERRPS